jgi:transcriptional regulator with XRE-family HTH domain
LFRCYIFRVENGHTIPPIETLEKMAHALECPLYQLFYDGEEPLLRISPVTGHESRLLQSFVVERNAAPSRSGCKLCKT